MKVSLEVTINGKGTMNDKFYATGPEGLLGGMHKCFSLMWLWLQIALHTTSRWYFSCTLFNHADNVAHKKFAIELRVFSSITTAAMLLFFLLPKCTIQIYRRAACEYLPERDVIMKYWDVTLPFSHTRPYEGESQISSLHYLCITLQY